MSNFSVDCALKLDSLENMNGELPVEREFLDILRKTCRTMRQSRQRPEMAIPAAQWELKINERIDELDRAINLELGLPGGKRAKSEVSKAA
jgi:hypothetical protein